MLINQAMEKLAQMKLEGFLDGLREQMGSPAFGDMPFEDRLGLLVDREYTLRENRRLTRRLQETRLKTRADFEDVDFRAKRGLDKRVYRTRRLLLDLPSPQPDHHWADGSRKELSRLRPGTKGLPRGLSVHLLPLLGLHQGADHLCRGRLIS